MPESTCSIEGCTKPRFARAMCQPHYYQWRKNTCPPCAVDGCTKPGTAVGMCPMHYARVRKHGDPSIKMQGGRRAPLQGCTSEGCERKHFAHGLCKRHYSQQPEQINKAKATDRARRSMPGYRERDRERLERRRRANGVAPKQYLTDDMRAARRRAAKHKRAKSKLNRAAQGAQGTRLWSAGPCIFCRIPFVGSHNSMCCSRTCRLRLERQKRKATYGSSNHRHRARLHGVRYETVSRIAVFERDGYRCQICKRKTKGRHWLAPGKLNPLAPTLDHIVPMACGGDHVLDNLQCACSECNSKKGDRAANDQLLLNVGAFV